MDPRQLDELSRTERLALLRFDQRQRWQRGDCALVEYYLEEFPYINRSSPNHSGPGRLLFKGNARRCDNVTPTSRGKS
jgi:hypothetical protein